MIVDTANAIAAKADAIANGTLVGPKTSAALNVLDNAKALLAYVQMQYNNENQD
jgi:hypothetical protein